MTYEHHIEEAAAALRAAQRLLSNEIAAYPTPIAGCDAQFNGLLADRSRVAGALRALGDAPFVPTPRVTEPPSTGPSDELTRPAG